MVYTAADMVKTLPGLASTSALVTVAIAMAIIKHQLVIVILSTSVAYTFLGHFKHKTVHSFGLFWMT